MNREGRLKENRRAAEEGNFVAESSSTEESIPTEEHSLLKDDTSAKETPSKKKKRPSVLEDILHLLLKILVIILLFVCLFTFLFGITRYNNLAMEPYVRAGDVVIYYRLDKRYAATDLVALRYKDEVHVLRVVAVAGDTVDIKEDGLYINGHRQQEPDPTQVTLPYVDQVDFPITLRKGEIFVLGDNRSVATDSRVMGAIPAKDTLGKVMMVIRRRNF